MPPHPQGSPDAVTMPLGPDRDLGGPTAPPLPHRRRGDGTDGADGPDGGDGATEAAAPGSPGAPEPDASPVVPPYSAGPTLSARGPDPLRKDAPGPVADSRPDDAPTDEGTPGRGTRSGEDPRPGEDKAP